MSLFRRRLMIAAALEQQPQPPQGKYIQFEDPEVERICMANFSSDGIGVSYEDVTNVVLTKKTGFNQNKNIHKFNEFKYFTGVRFQDGQSGYFVFSGSSLEEISFPETLKNISNETFNYCSKLYNIKNTDYIEVLDNKAFAETALENIAFPSLKAIGQRCFYGAKIVSISNLGYIMETGTNSFQGCSNLVTVKLPSTLEVIKNGTFYQCSKLSLLDLPAKVNMIEEFALGLTNLTALISRNPIPPSFKPKGQGSIGAIYVPDSSVEAYKTAPNWSAYADKIKPLSSYVEPTK